MGISLNTLFHHLKNLVQHVDDVKTLKYQKSSVKYMNLKNKDECVEVLIKLRKIIESTIHRESFILHAKNITLLRMIESDIDQIESSQSTLWKKIGMVFGKSGNNLFENECLNIKNLIDNVLLKNQNEKDAFVSWLCSSQARDPLTIRSYVNKIKLDPRKCILFFEVSCTFLMWRNENIKVIREIYDQIAVFVSKGQVSKEQAYELSKLADDYVIAEEISLHFKVEEQSFFVDKLLLAVKSPRFQDYFQLPYREDQDLENIFFPFKKESIIQVLTYFKTDLLPDFSQMDDDAKQAFIDLLDFLAISHLELVRNAIHSNHKNLYLNLLSQDQLEITVLPPLDFKGFELLGMRPFSYHVQHLDLTKLSSLSDDQLLLIMDYFPNISKLTLPLPNLLTPTGWKCLLDIKRLTIINLNLKDSEDDLKFILPEELKNEAYQFELTCDFIKQKNLKNISYIADHCFNLRKIDAYLSYDLDKKELIPILKKCRNIRHLGFSDPLLYPCCTQIVSLPERLTLSNDDIKNLADHYPDLTTLNLSRSMITDEVLAYLLLKCKKLESLDLSGCQLITDKSIEKLAKTQLKILFLHHCDNLTAKAAPLITENPHLSLHAISLPTSWGTDTTLRALADHHPVLNNLSMYNGEVSDAGMIYFAEKHRNLTNLRLIKCLKITVETVLSLAKSCPWLENLDLQECQNLSIESLQTLTANCHSLNSLALRECPSFGYDDDLWSLALKYPRVKIYKPRETTSLSIAMSEPKNLL